MTDVLILAVVLAFFGLCVPYVALCDRIVGTASDLRGKDEDEAEAASGRKREARSGGEA
ncbi:MAG: hypothetical protein IT198_01505 [Acidimicrobiia bacterium]|nr:hypothetical protein [Acidimicrobiia bacterium]